MPKENETTIIQRDNKPSPRPEPNIKPFEAPEKGAFEPKKPIKPPKVSPPTPPPGNN
jgi:hypothetical protein